MRRATSKLFAPPRHPQIEQIVLLLRSVGWESVREYRFHPDRRWRFDVAVPARKVAFEYHGHAGFIGGKVSGHSTIKGLTNDCEKLNQARLLGWTVIAFTALHFREAERIRHKLQSPTQIIEQLAREAKGAAK
jgi:hypothetical protein